MGKILKCQLLKAFITGSLSSHYYHQLTKLCWHNWLDHHYYICLRCEVGAFCTITKLHSCVDFNTEDLCNHMRRTTIILADNQPWCSFGGELHKWRCLGKRIECVHGGAMPVCWSSVFVFNSPHHSSLKFLLHRFYNFYRSMALNCS